MDELHAADPMISVRMLHTALVHLALRARRNPPQRPMPDPPDGDKLSVEAFRFEMARRISTWLGQPTRCPDRACQRAKVCHGDPPDCWRAEPPPTPREINLAKSFVQYHLGELRAEWAHLETEDAHGA